MKFYNLIFLISLLGIISCKDQYTKDIEQWRGERITNLKASDGWLSLVGLYWIDGDSVSIGSAASNSIQFPAKAPNQIGHLKIKNSRWDMTFDDHVQVFVKGIEANATNLKIDEGDDPAPITWGSLEWFVIKRGEKYAIRLRDTLSEARNNFKGIANFDVDPNWQLEGTISYYEPVKEIEIENILGTTSTEKSPAKIEFTKDGQSFSLDLLDGGYGKYFVIFSDTTNGQETYDGGRYIYIDKPKGVTTSTIDFNKAYNPPCVFTPYATCPIPPAQNRLSLAVTAGEKNYKH